MKKLFAINLLSLCIASYATTNEQPSCTITLEKSMSNSSQTYVQKKVLSNGMTILVRPVRLLPRVCMQLWYEVGSKDEQTGEKGIAHLIEHMIFKGTQKLSESDINVIAHKLSGSINAFTSYDYTGYLFNMPEQHWREILPIMADCMQNVSFKDDHLNSEMKAVIQELKLHKDNYVRTVLFELLGDIFPDHPYHYPVIGFKQDLWSIKGSDLRAFYQKHYWPNNATLVVVGDVDAQEVFKLAEEAFGKIPANLNYKKQQFYHTTDILARSVTIYRDIQQPTVFIGYEIPGTQSKIGHLVDVVNLILGEGKASRLQHLLVDEKKLVTRIGTFCLDLFEHGVYFVGFEPKNVDDIPKIIDLVQKEIDSIVENGVKEQELDRAVKQARMKYYNLLEQIEEQARQIGESYLATGDAEYPFHYLDESTIETEHEMQRLFSQYFRPSVRHQAIVLPIAEQEKSVWKELQEQSDQLDAEILAARRRDTPIENPVYAEKVTPKEVRKFDFPKPQTFTLKNGLKVLYYHTANTPKIDVSIRLQAAAYYEPEDKAGVYSFTTNMMNEGTEKYTARELAHEFENRGMSLALAPGAVAMNMLSPDLTVGMTLLEEVLSRPRFDAQEIEKVRAQMLTGLKNFWDDPSQFSGQLISERVYPNHPFSKRTIGTEKSLAAMTREDLVACHKKFITPHRAVMAIVGDIKSYNLQEVLEKTIGKWKGPEIEPIVFPPLPPVKPSEIVYPINRDQVVLAFAGLSVERKSPDFDKLLLFDQIFGGGALGSMHSKLFQLREQSGLFYGIRGSLTSNASEDKGLVSVSTKVSMDRLKEAEKVIKHTIDTATQEVSDHEFTEARHAIANVTVNHFATNQSIAQAFLTINRYGFPLDYYDTRNERLMKISKQEMIDAVKKYLSTSRMVELKVGRLEPQKAQACGQAEPAATSVNVK